MSPPMASLPTSFFPTTDEKVLDADEIERWLTSPSQTDPTKIHSTATVDDTLSRTLPKRSVAGIAARRRKNQDQYKKQQEDSVPETTPQHEELSNDGGVKPPHATHVSPRASLHRIKLRRKQRELRRQQQQQQQAREQEEDQNATIAVTTDSSAKNPSSYLAHTKVISTNHYDVTETMKDDQKRTVGKRVTFSPRYDRKDPKHDHPVVVSDDEEDEEIDKEGILAFLDTAVGRTRNVISTKTKKPQSPTKAVLANSNIDENDDKKVSIQGDQSPKEGSPNRHISGRITRSVVASPGIENIRRRRQQRLQQRELEKELKDIETELEEEQSVAITKASLVTPTRMHESKQENKNIATISPFLGMRIDEDDSGNSKAPKTEVQRTIVSNGDDKQVFSISPTKKIHLLKRHSAGGGKNPIVNATSHRIGVTTTRSIYDEPVATSFAHNPQRDQAITNNQQLSDGTNNLNCENEQEHQDSVTNPLNCPETPGVSRIESSYQHNQSASDNPNKTTTLSKMEQRIARDNGIVANVKNTRRIKEAVARSRHCCRGMYDSKMDCIGIASDQVGIAADHGEMMVKRHFQSGSISCSSLSTAGVSTDTGPSAGSSDEEDDASTSDTAGDEDEDETTALTSITEMSDSDAQVGENLYSLSVPVPSKFVEMSMYKGGLIDSVDKHEIILPKEKQYLKRNSEVKGESAIVLPTIDSTGGGTSSSKYAIVEQLQLQRNKKNRIKLNVYDLLADDTQLDLWGCHFPLGRVFNAVNSSLHSIGTGAYHVGLEIDGVEYAYGANNTRGLTGVFTCIPKNSPGYQFRSTIDFGDRFVVKKSRGADRKRSRPVNGSEVVREMATEYLGTDYDLLRKNCCTFAHDACVRLGIREEEIPSWFHNLAQVGALTQDAASLTLAPITQLFEQSDTDMLMEYVNETPWDDSNNRLEAIPDDNDSEEYEEDEPIVDASTAYQF